MGLDDALIFTRVVECHSFTNAALMLGMQKSTVSRRIAQLEERLGVRLLNRTTRKLRLTEVGEAYYERCRQIMQEFAEAEEAIMQLQSEPTGLLRITSTIEFGQLLLGAVVGEFVGRYPNLQVDVELTSRHIDPVEEGVDIAIQLGRPQDSSLVARPLLLSPRQLFASPAYLAEFGEPKRPEDLSRHRCIQTLIDEGRKWQFVEPCVNVPVPHAVTVNNITFAREAAAAGGGIINVPSFIAQPLVEEGRLCRVLADCVLPSTQLYALYPSRRFQSMKVKTFIDYLLEKLEQRVKDRVETTDDPLVKLPTT
ncbi:MULTISPECIES: LysR family transcriptional regulator [Halopseudomonas]|uniref:DNA-binding transcriptional regulator, LysR family n=1 Tax=Halopseudomonas formosensis TaxID=1002526 RepID=A0A1I6BGL4_9GAMM|nr:LysR family transcriptional regulator [Halopseudomonas formosensis]MDX9686732.1 LysR family transcriptional regulator [Halopseudomonas formosensis]NLC02056.1 LysR family transcriptional regulator [Halopseudomonas formosensis]SFQ80080.1 DNA-binding transcriptional regulator, LysR family [Halopseudomonas formosensis]